MIPTLIGKFDSPVLFLAKQALTFFYHKIDGIGQALRKGGMDFEKDY